MPGVRENLQKWGHEYAWREDGEDWSKGWGTSLNQWMSFLYPRIHPFLPAQTIVEIATGTGRWTNFLREHCDRLIGIDLAPKCIETCKHRFVDDHRLEFHVTDGMSMPIVADQSADMVFSFDSLVHVEHDVMDSYLREINRILKPDGVAFLHHSNLAMYKEVVEMLRSVPVASKALKKANILDTGWRGLTVSAALVEQLAKKHGLNCVGQELVNWGNTEPAWLNDAISLIARPESKWDRPNRVWKDDRFMEIIDYQWKMGEIFGVHSFPGAAVEARKEARPVMAKTQETLPGRGSNMMISRTTVPGGA